MARRRSLGEGGYSNRARGERAKHKAKQEEDIPQAPTVEIIDVSDHQPRRIPSKKWRELIKKVWECDPLLCACGAPMRIVSLCAAFDYVRLHMDLVG